MSQNNVLVIAPHPDDETFGCGGTIATLSASGASVYVQVVIEHAINTGGPQTHKMPVEREREFELACDDLGVRQHDTMLQHADPHTVLYEHQAHLVEFLESGSPLALDEIHPRLVLMPARSSFHQDHKIVHDAAFAACRNRGLGHFLPPIVLGYQCPEDSWSSFSEPISCYFDTSAAYSHKEAAMARYQRQVKPEPHPRTATAIRRMDAAFGTRIGVALAEAFVTYRFDLSNYFRE